MNKLNIFLMGLHYLLTEMPPDSLILCYQTLRTEKKVGRRMLIKWVEKKEILDSRFNAYLTNGEQLSMIPRVSDGQLLFLLNNTAKDEE